MKTWAVVEFQDPNSGARRYIAKIFKTSKGALKGKFVRSKITRDYNGYIYAYPDVTDISKIHFDQIKKSLPNPTVYGRGLLKFCINSNDLRIGT